MPTTYSRRTVLKGGAAFFAAQTLHLVGRTGVAFGATTPDPATANRNRLVIINLAGGNDGLNTVVPIADADGTQRRSVYEKVRPSLGYASGALLPLDRPNDAGHKLGLNPKLTNIHQMYRSGRVSVVQGVDYPNHNYSHFESNHIWQSGRPEIAADSGWIGRHFDRAGIGPGEVRGLAIGGNLPLLLAGREDQGVSLRGVPALFPDGTAAFAAARHKALELFAAHPTTEPLRHMAGQNAQATAGLVSALQSGPAPQGTGSALADALLAARVLMEGNFGVEVVHVQLGSFDTHTTQLATQEALLAQLDYAVHTFLNGDPAKTIAPMAPAVAARTLVMTYSEFGRRLGENGSGGTDHGAAGPVFLVGPAGRLVPGLHGAHPEMGTTTLPADNLMLTTDMRSLYQTVLEGWLADPEPGYASTLPLFTP